MYEQYDPAKLSLPKFVFFTGKGGVGKTSAACATAVGLADGGNTVLLVSTDPASNLQDVFEMSLNNERQPIDKLPNLYVANLDPEESARKYKEAIIGPYRGLLPETVINEMEEKLSGSCTVEVSAFNEFANYLTDDDISNKFDYVIFDTAPTGHSLRLLQLPSAWNKYVSEKEPENVSIGQYSGLQGRRDECQKAVETLSDPHMTKIVLVSKAESISMMETERAMRELKELGITSFALIINGVFQGGDDDISRSFFEKQQRVLDEIPEELACTETYAIPLRSYNIIGIDNLRRLLNGDDLADVALPQERIASRDIRDLIDDLYENKKKVIFMMGKGGVGKTTVAAIVAMGLWDKGAKVHLTTTDPAAHIQYLIRQNQGITLSRIDEQAVLEEYKEEVMSEAKLTMDQDALDYLTESLKTPCTQEIAVFRAFSKIVEKADDEVVVIDTAPTGHTLLLLDSTQRNSRQMESVQDEIPQSVRNLLPRLRNKDETEVVIITLPEITPVYEAARLQKDLERAGIFSKWWVVNSSFYLSETENQLLKLKAVTEIKWINEAIALSGGNCAVIPWTAGDVMQNAAALG